MDNDAPIYNMSQACNNLFAKILNKPGTSCALVAEVLHLRFNQWTSYLGVFAQENMSLDTRLQYSQSISELVFQFLKIVSRNLEHVDTLYEDIEQASLIGDDLQQSVAEEVEQAPESGASSPLVESLRAIKLAIDGLYRLGAAIRQSSSSALTQRIGRFIEENDDLAIENLVFLRLKHKFFDSSENGSNCRSPLSLYKQLATSISFRYYGIRYRQERQDKIEKRREALPVLRRTSEMTDAPKEKKKSGQNELKKLAIANARTQQKLKKEEPPTTIHSKNVLAKYASTEKSFAKPKSVLSSYMKDTKYPDAPKVDPRTREARCPFCAKPISEMDLRRKDWWHHHLNQDLKLYSCLSEGCAEPPQFFVHFQEWKQHMDESHTANWIREIHKPHGWCCDVEHDDLYFEDEAKYDQHVQEIHPEYEAEKSELKEWAELQRERPHYTCPICNRVPIELVTIHPRLDNGELTSPETTITDATLSQREEAARNKLLLHIGTHLKELGLMSIAYFEDEDENRMESKRGSIHIDEDGKILFIEDPPNYLDPQFDGFIDEKDPSSLSIAVDWSSVKKISVIKPEDDPILQWFRRSQQTHWNHSSSLRALIGDEFSWIRTVSGLFEAIQHEQENINTMALDDKNRPERYKILGAMFSEQYLRTRDLNNLGQAIEALRTAIDILPENSADESNCLYHLGAIFGERYLQTRSAPELDSAIDAMQMAVNSALHDQPEKISYMISLRILLSDKWRTTRDTSDIERAISVARSLTTIMPDNHPDSAACLSELVTLLSGRFERTRERIDLDEAIDVMRSLVDASSRDSMEYPTYRNKLGSLLNIRFDEARSVNDLTEAIDATLEVANLTLDYHYRAVYLNNCGRLLDKLFHATGSIDDLNRAIDAASEAVKIAPRNRRYWSEISDTLRSLLVKRFSQTGSMDDLNRAISIASDVAASDVAASAYLPARYSNNLRSLLYKRFQQTKSLDDLDLAVLAAREALQKASEGDKDYIGYLYDLSFVLATRFIHTRRLSDLDEAIDETKSIIEFSHYHRLDYNIHLNNLGTLLGSKFNETKEMSSLNEAIDKVKSAVRGISGDNLNFSTYLRNLRDILNTRYEQTGWLHHLNEVNEIATHIGSSSSLDYPDYASQTRNLKKVLEEKLPEKYGLLIASPFNGLQGPLNDASLVKETLQRFGFGDIQYCGTESTGEDIRRSWEDLITKAKENDVIVIFYSGFGGTVQFPSLQQTVNDSTEAGAMSTKLECHHFMVPQDFENSIYQGFRGILDNEISTLMSRTTQKTKNVTVVFDCSFSSNLQSLRYENAVPKMLDDHYQPIIKGYIQSIESGEIPRVREQSIFEDSQGVVKIFAAADSEVAWEYANKQGHYVGAFTEALVSALDEALTAGMSWQEAMLAVRKQVNSNFPEQNPLAVGPCTRSIFSQELK